MALKARFSVHGPSYSPASSLPCFCFSSVPVCSCFFSTCNSAMSVIFFYGICAGPLRCMFWGAPQTGLAERYHRRLCDDQPFDHGAVSGAVQSAQAGAMPHSLWHRLTCCFLLQAVEFWRFLARLAYKLLPFVAGMYVVRANVFEWLDLPPFGAARYQLVSGWIVCCIAGYAGVVAFGATCSQVATFVRLTSYPMASSCFLILVWIYGNSRLYWISAVLALLG